MPTYIYVEGISVYKLYIYMYDVLYTYAQSLYPIKLWI